MKSIIFDGIDKHSWILISLPVLPVNLIIIRSFIRSENHYTKFCVATLNPQNRSRDLILINFLTGSTCTCTCIELTEWFSKTQVEHHSTECLGFQVQFFQSN